MNIKGKIVQGLGSQVLVAAVSIVCQVVTLMVLSRYLSPEDFGVLALCSTFISFSNIYVDCGISPALVYYGDGDDGLISSAFWLSLMMGVGLYLIIFFGAEGLSRLFTDDSIQNELKVYSLVFVILSLSLTSKALLERRLLFKKLMMVEIVKTICVTTFSITLVYYGVGVWGVILANVVGAILYSLILLFMEPPPVKNFFKKEDVSKLMGYGGGLTLSRTFNHIANQADTIVVGGVLGVESLGYYERASKIIRMPSLMMGQVLDKVTFPVVARFKDNTEGVIKGYSKAVVFGVTLQIVAAFTIFMMSDELVAVVLGEQWSHVSVLLKIMAWCMPLRIMVRMADAIVRAKGGVYKSAWRKFLYSLIVISSCVFAVRWGVEGVAYAVLFSALCNYWMMSKLCHMLIGLESFEYFKVLLRSCYLSLFVALIVWAVLSICRHYFSTDLYVLMASSVVILILAVSIILFLRKKKYVSLY